MKHWKVIAAAAAGLLALGLAGPKLADYLKKEHEAVENKSKRITVSYYFPEFSYFTDIVTGQKKPEAKLMEGYHFGKPYIFGQYYDKVASTMPEVPEGHYLLAFCEYYKDNLNVAQTEFEKAIRINPYFFWSYYNLGIVYLEQKDYERSILVLTMAMQANRDAAILQISQSPFFRQIWRSLPDPQETLQNNLIQGLKDTAILLAFSCLKAGKYDQALELIQSAESHIGHPDITSKIKQYVIEHKQPDETFERLIKEQVPVRIF